MKIGTKPLVVLAVALIGLYLAGVLATGLGWNPSGINWNFENSGQFGDSFGPLGALMSAIAAVSALLAYWSQREELGRLKLTEAKNQKRMDRRDFEETFFKLLTLFRETLTQVKFTSHRPREDAVNFESSYAFSKIMRRYFGRDEVGSEKVATQFARLYDTYQGDLGHYFRLFYHVLKFVDDSNIDDKMRYARFLRALLSRTEILLIALNCAHGGGREKLKPLVERYAMLHNISASEARRLHIIPLFATSAFGDRALESEREHSD